MARSTATVATATEPTSVTSVKPATIKSCGAYVKAHETDAKFADRIAGRSLTCKRLPMHKGECRVTLHEVKATVAKSAKRKVSGRSKARVTRVDAFAAIASDLESGKLTAGEALAKAAAFVTRATKPRTARKPVTATLPNGAVVTGAVE